MLNKTKYFQGEYILNHLEKQQKKCFIEVYTETFLERQESSWHLKVLLCCNKVLVLCRTYEC